MWIYARTPLSPPIAVLMEMSLMPLIRGQRHGLNIHFAMCQVIVKTPFITSGFRTAEEQRSKMTEFIFPVILKALNTPPLEFPFHWRVLTACS